MGISASQDTRRISFDNTIAFNSALTVSKALQDENPIDFENIAAVGRFEII